jgi:2-polyprenyl-3-methyl-5-hydroxy-6-metoxy-1,4-benzoquinol methylase
MAESERRPPQRARSSNPAPHRSPLLPAESGEHDRHLMMRRQAGQAILQGQFEMAARTLSRVLREAPKDPTALALMAEVQLGLGDAGTAFEFSVKAVNAAPHVHAHKKRFLDLCRRGFALGYSNALANAIAACLRTPEFSGVLTAWTRLLFAEPGFAKAYGLAGRRPFDPANGPFFASLTDFRPLFSPLFLEGLKAGIVCDPLFEEFVVHIRRHLLADMHARAPRLTPQERLLLASSLAHYAFRSDYILEESADEAQQAEALRLRIETGTEVPRDTGLIAMLACYRPLHALSNARAILECFESGPLADLVKLQIGVEFALREVEPAIPSRTGIAEGASRGVQRQYEDFPYPQWSLPAQDIILQDWTSRDCMRTTEAGLTGKKARILIAGCGTGRQAAIAAAIFPDAQITAIDLSRRSLAYAALCARTHALSNIAFEQGDILKLDPRGQAYDYIQAVGVLHHMQDPSQGWKILSGLLKDRGLMLIALYSKTGRQAVAAVRAALAQGNYPPTREGLSRARRDARSLCDMSSLMKLSEFQDYYHLNMYRDLLFPAQERVFELTHIESMLGELGLSFAGFSLNNDIREKYRARFPHDGALAELKNWIAFERDYPDTFREMYTFWCRKNPAG